MPDITALGAAMAAGHAEGIEAWEFEGEEVESVPTDTFLPTTTPEGKDLSDLVDSCVSFNFTTILSFLFVGRDARYTKWKMAVERSLGWSAIKKSDQMTGKFKSIEQIKSAVSGVIDALFFKYS